MGMEQMPNRRKVLGILGGAAGAAAFGAKAEAAEKKVDSIDINEQMDQIEHKIGELQAAIKHLREVRKEHKMEDMGEEFKSYDAIGKSGEELEKLTHPFKRK